jgi:DNA-binding transcriptional MerR regulator
MESRTGPQPRSGRDLFMVPMADRLNDQFRLIDTMILAMTDSWTYLPPRARHILWLRLASAEASFLTQVGLPMENGILVHWSMWPDDLGDYAQAVAMRMTRQQLEYLEPKNVAMASAIRQAEIAETTARLQIQLAQSLIQLSQLGAGTQELARLFSKNKFDKEAIGQVLDSANDEIQRREQQMQQQMAQQQSNTVNEELRATPQELPTGPCAYCGQIKPYVMGQDDQGMFVVECCQDCLPQANIDFEQGEVPNIIDSMNESMTDEEMVFISENTSYTPEDENATDHEGEQEDG